MNPARNTGLGCGDCFADGSVDRVAITCAGQVLKLPAVK